VQCVVLVAAGDLEVSRTLVETTKLFKVTVSFGNVISLISLPCFMSHASIPAEVRAARGLPDDLVRISAGIEDIGDLIADLKQALDKAWAEKQQRQPQATSSSNGSSAGVAAAGSNGAERIQQLEQRIQQLEAQLQNGQPLQNTHRC
jgi:cystathionine beta-lyase